LESGSDCQRDYGVSRACEEDRKRSPDYGLWVENKQPSQSPQTSCQRLPRQLREPVGCPARTAWRTGHRCRTCSAENGRIWTGCCIYREVAISCLGPLKIGRWWDVLSEVWVSMFTFGMEHTLAMPYLIDWLGLSAVPICIATTPAFSDGGNLHDPRRQRRGCGVVQGGKSEWKGCAISRLTKPAVRRQTCGTAGGKQ
jgi:hypothetical protein